MTRKSIPERTCRGCGRKGPQSALVRFVLKKGELIEDQWGGMPGRGVYCCNETSCRTRLARSKKILKTGGRHARRLTGEGGV